MAMMGLPSERDIIELFGYVTEEDRQKWDQYKSATRGELAKNRRGPNGTDLVNQGVQPGLGLAERALNSQLFAAQNKSMRDERPKKTVTYSHQVDADEEEFEPER